MTLNCVNDVGMARRRLMVCLSLIDWLEWSFWRKKVSRIRIKVKWNKVIFFEKEFEKCIMQNRKEHLLSFDLTRFDNVWRMSHLAAPALHVSTFWVAKKWNPSLVTPCHKKELWRITRPKVVEKGLVREKWCSTKTSLPTLAMITTPFPKVKRKQISENKNFHPWLLYFE